MLKIFRNELDLLKRIVNTKGVEFPDFRVHIEGDQLVSAGYCAEKTFVYHMQQRLSEPAPEPMDFVLAKSEFNNIHSAFAGSIELKLESKNDIVTVSSGDGKRTMDMRQVVHTTMPIEIRDPDPERYDIFDMKVSALKSLTSGLDAIKAKEMMISTKSGRIEAFFSNTFNTSLKLSEDIPNIEMRGQTVRFDSLFNNVLAIFEPLETVQVNISMNSPLVLRQMTDSYALKAVIVPFEA